MVAILDLSATYWLNHFQNIKIVFIDPNYVINDVLKLRILPLSYRFEKAIIHF